MASVRPPLRRLIRRLVRKEDGIVLVLAVAAMTILAITTTGVIVAGTANQTTAAVSTDGRSAFAVAQAALAYGEGMVYGDVVSGIDVPEEPQNLPMQPDGATGTFTATTSDSVTWHVVGTGTVRGVTRTVSADVTPAQTVTTQQYAIWNYLFEASKSANCISGGSVISVPILTGSDLCLSGSNTKILNNLEVGRNLVTSGNAQIGTASSPISKLEVVGTCAVNGPAKPAGVSPCDGSHNLTYASTVGNTLDTTPVLPTVDFAGAYAAQAAFTQVGCPANLFDKDTTLNNDNSANISSILFGGTDYDCVIASNELKWNHTTKQLYASGTFYFDGTLTVSGGSNVVYSGLASLYFTGGVTLSTGSLCGVAGCGTGWDTENNVLFLIAQCWQDATGSHLLTNGCVNLSGGATDQFGAYVATNYNVNGGSGNMGPVMCDTFSISGGSDILIPIKNFPPGTPAPSTTVAYTGTPPTNWSG